MISKKPPLGQLEKVDLRSYWEHEALSFTPWLAEDENLKLLSDTIGLTLELVKQEANVGPFQADLLCKLSSSDHYVVIENQLERTDHSHLGQLLTYAAGLEAATIIWIAPRFTEEHRAALDWLNRMTREGLYFFGIEIELWKIGNSSPAAKFNIVSKPNDWAKQVMEATKGVDTLSTTKQTYFDYWVGFNAELDIKGKKIHPVKPTSANWLTYGAGSGKMTLEAVANSSEGWVGARLGFNDKAIYFKLQEEREEIENSIGQPLDWIDETGRIVCKHPAKLEDRDTWDQLFKWQREALETFVLIFTPKVKNLLP